jgi:hypothetical protein
VPLIVLPYKQEINILQISTKSLKINKETFQINKKIKLRAARISVLRKKVQTSMREYK